ncbi:MAG: hypothetical protein ABR559_07940 [Gemmatimonadota bacterium]
MALFKSKQAMWTTVGLGGCLGLILLVVVIFLGARAWSRLQDGDLDADDRMTEVSDDEASDEEDDDGPGVPTVTFVNDRSRLTGGKAEHFVDFTFDYPASWAQLEDGTGDDQNFVKVERQTEDEFTIENFAVGWFAGMTPGMAAVQVEGLTAAGFPEYQKGADETTLVAGRMAQGFRFSARLAETPRGPIDIWGRMLFVPVSETNGVVLTLLVSGLSEDVHGPSDVGEAGELPVILQSFRFGGN